MYSKEKQYKIAMILLCPVQGPWAFSFNRDTPRPVSLYANNTDCFNLSAIYKSCKHYKFVIGPVFELINTPNQSLIKQLTNDVNNLNVICFHFRSQLFENKT